MPIWLLLALGGGGYYVYKKKKDPSWSPMKGHALGKVKKTSAAATPSPTVGLDPGMTSEQVAAVNAALSSATDPAPVYALASQLSDTAPNSAKALIAKADALSAAKAQGASDAQVLQAMMTAGTPSGS